MESEKRLIYSHKAENAVSAVLRDSTLGPAAIGVLVQAIQNVEKVPTVDAVEVVRCKDCVNYCGFEHCKNGICDVDSVSKRAVYPYDFCSYGERKDND